MWVRGKRMGVRDGAESWDRVGVCMGVYMGVALWVECVGMKKTIGYEG